MNEQDTELSIRDYRVSNDKVYWSFNENDYTITYDKKTKQLACNCINGSNWGINNKQICKHKKFIIKKYRLENG